MEAENWRSVNVFIALGCLLKNDYGFSKYTYQDHDQDYEYYACSVHLHFFEYRVSLMTILFATKLGF